MLSAHINHKARLKYGNDKGSKSFKNLAIIFFKNDYLAQYAPYG